MGQNKHPMKIGVVGLTHGHVHWILGGEDLGDIQIVGIVESNRGFSGTILKTTRIPYEYCF